MRVLVTGGSGQLGQEWVRFLNRKEVEFIALPSSDLDITDFNDTNRVLTNLQPDLIINCAAYTKVDKAEEQAELAFKVNAEAVENLASYCKSHHIKLIHYSTDYVFSGSLADREKLPEGYPEDYPTSPQNVYGKSKLAGEQAIIESECEHLIVRISWLCGTFGHNFVKTMLKLGKERDELQVVNDQFGTPTFAENVVENCWQLIKNNESGVFHLSSQEETTWFHFAEEIFKQSGVDVKLVPVDSSAFPAKAKRPAFSLLSTQKIANISGVSLITWKQGLQKLLTDLQTHS